MKNGKILPPEIVEENLGVNPFISGLVIKVRAIRSGYVPDGEDEGVVMVDNVVELERDGYVKVFDGADERVIMAGLSYRALQMWMWMLYTVKSGKDYLWVNVPRLMKECGMKSIKTHKAAITELCRYGYVAPCVGHKNVYWLNPSMAFKGSRIKKYPGNVVKSVTE